MTDAKPSKSERKRLQLELQVLGEKLALLPVDIRHHLPLGDRLQEALDELRHMTAHEAIRRQKQFIGKLMRDVEAEPIRVLFAERSASEHAEKRLFARAETWRDRLVVEQRAALAAFETETGRRQTDIERVLDELAAVRDERNEKRLRRELFRHIHAALVAAALDG